MRVRCAVAVLGLLAGLLTGCEGVNTGTEIANVALQPAESGTAGGVAGAYAPLKFTLSPGMNPIAFNLRADFTQDPAEFGKWNSYRATLMQNGAMVASRNFNVNHPQSSAQGDAPPPAGTIHTLFYVDVHGTGEFELTITPSRPVAITLKDARVDARRNVQRPPQ